MPFKTLKLLPGVNLERSPSLNEAQLAFSNLIRFYGALPQKLGGWAQLTAQLFIGTCRGLHGWADIIGNAYLAIGTEQRLEVYTGGVLYDITPIADTTNPAVSFSTTIGSSTVAIHDAGYSPDVGDWINLLTQVSVGGLVLFGYYQVTGSLDANDYTITATGSAISIGGYGTGLYGGGLYGEPNINNATGNVTNGGAVAVYTTTNGLATVNVLLDNHGFSMGSIYDAAIPTTVGGLTISGNYSVTSVVDIDNFVITASAPATGNATLAQNGGNAQIQYLLPSGPAVATFNLGYGSGLYGAGLYGVANASGMPTVTPLRQWSLDNWGQDLIASPTNGKIYYWQPPIITPAIPVSSTAPIYNISVFVMSQVQIIVALGAETGGTQEPLLVRWSDAGDFTDWTPTATNQAGSYQIPTGSKMVGGLAVGLGALLWTDLDLWSMTYQGLPFVFGFNRIATACGLISMRAVGIAGSFVMWLSTRGFFTYSLGGGVTPVECQVWDFLIDNIDTNQFDQVHCAINGLFNEMAWHFPLSQSSPLYSASAPMGYVKVNYVENLIWDYGLSPQYQRTAWVGHTPVGFPIGSDLNGLLQQHEIGYDANGVGMQWSWQTGYFDILDGEEFVFSDLLIPDNVTIGNPTIFYTIYVTAYPNTASTVLGPYAAMTTTDFIAFRGRGRQMAIGASGSDLGTFNRLGALRYRFARDGRV
jgi:hypothetical protein